MSNLSDSLNYNEYIQNKYFNKFNNETVYLTFSFNVPRRVCTKIDIEFFFDSTVLFILKCFKEKDINLKKLGIDYNFAVFKSKNNISPKVIKQKCIELEKKIIGGRVLDIDVYIGKKQISRGKSRNCYVCDNSHIDCRNAKNHKEITIEYYFLINFSDFIFNNILEKYCEIGKKIKKEILFSMIVDAIYEKPFLISPMSNGIHDDMDYKLFVKSIFSIYPMFIYFFYFSIIFKDLSECFIYLKYHGINIENRMFKSTNGVNTHKGMIFLFGIVLSSLGYKLKVGSDFIDNVKKLGKLSFNSINKDEMNTKGIILFTKYNIQGIRGECAKGIPSAIEALKFLKKMDYSSFDDRYFKLLIYIFSLIEDTNIIKKTNVEDFFEFRNNLRKDIKKYGINNNIIEKFNNFLSEINASPGGSADILTITVFLDKMKKFWK